MCPPKKNVTEKSRYFFYGEFQTILQAHSHGLSRIVVTKKCVHRTLCLPKTKNNLVFN